MKFDVAILDGCCSLLRAALLVTLGFCTLAGMPLLAHAQETANAASLKARHAALREQLASNPFQRPLTLESSQTSGNLRGDIYARIEQPYATAGPALQGMDYWCDILILHLNVKSCRTGTNKAGDRQDGGSADAGRTPKAAETLSLNIGRKFDQPLADTYRVEFLYKVVAATPDYLHVELNAEKGPLGTSRYRIVLEVAALDAQRSFLHMSYSYAYGMAARIAMQGYLATTGRNKLGFSIVGRKANGEPDYMGGVRGVVERNTMRYYLAIEAYLGALSVPAPERLEKRLNDWYAGIERYPVQLHELERGEYLDMKRKEVQRQQAPGLAAAANSGRPAGR